MKRAMVIVVVLAASLFAGCLPPEPPPYAPGYPAARAYAKWCGGRVTDPYGVQGGPYVVDCTRQLV